MIKAKAFITSIILTLIITVSVMPLPILAKESETRSMKELFSRNGIKVGTCLSPVMIYGPGYSELVKREFSSVTLENALKPDFILNKKASVEAGYPVVELNSEAVAMMDWAKENGLSMRGHTLVWYSQTPDWIFHEEFNESKPLVSSDVMLNRMDHYIEQVFSILEEKGYIDLFYAYDIVNEGINDNGSLRDCLWKETIGDDYIWHAFYFADKYAPESIDLYYNDYNEQFKYGSIMDLAKTLVDEEGNYLIDGIGLQAHLYTKDDLNTYFRAMEALSSTGLKVQVTELDVALGSWQNVLPADEKNLEDQKQFYKKLVDGTLERVESGKINLDAFTFWGFADNLSWRNDRSPLLFDKDLVAKPAYYGVIEAAEKYSFGDSSDSSMIQDETDDSEVRDDIGDSDIDADTDNSNRQDNGEKISIFSKIINLGRNIREEIKRLLSF